MSITSTEIMLASILEHIAQARVLVEDAGAVLIGRDDVYVAGAMAAVAGFLDACGMLIAEVPDIQSMAVDDLKAAARKYLAGRQSEELGTNG